MKKSRLGAIITSIAIIAVLTIGITLALLSATTDTKVNAFSSNKNIDIALRESKWDGYDFNDTNPGNGTTAKDESDMTLGVNQAKNYVPGQEIPKNPTVKNTGDTTNGVDAYVAIRVRYYSVAENGEKTQMTCDAFKAAYLEESINFNNKWIEIQTSTDDQNDQVFLYGTEEEGTVLTKEEKTNALFDEVKLSTELTPDETGKLPGFAIEVQAFAIQSDNVTDVTTTMLDFVNAN